MSVMMPLMFGSVARLITGMVIEPAATVATLLYYANLLPRSVNLERLVQHQLMLIPHNYFFNFVINIMTNFW
ncbi:hypothetical protein U1Q18_006617 [Sarracenia purpurea var. burkii]